MPRMLNDLTSSLSNFLFVRGYWEEHVRLNEWGYEAAKALGGWHQASWRASQVAFIHYRRAETGSAAIWVDYMTDAMERGGDRSGRAAAIRMRGLIEQQQGNLAEAGIHLTEALVIFHELADEETQSTVLSDLGSIMRKRKKYDSAEVYYRQALALAEKIGDQQYQSTNCNNLGHLAMECNRPTKARPWFERGLALARTVGRQDQIATALGGLAEVLESEQHYIEALRYAEQALHIRERLRDQNLEWTRELVARLRKKAWG
jgi:tetratricopeptide (TPR) repeat protein